MGSPKQRYYVTVSSLMYDGITAVHFKMSSGSLQYHSRVRDSGIQHTTVMCHYKAKVKH